MKRWIIGLGFCLLFFFVLALALSFVSREQGDLYWIAAGALFQTVSVGFMAGVGSIAVCIAINLGRR